MPTASSRTNCALLIVDTVASLSAVPLDVTTSAYSCFSGSQKAIIAPPENVFLNCESRCPKNVSHAQDKVQSLVFESDNRYELLGKDASCINTPTNFTDLSRFAKPALVVEECLEATMGAAARQSACAHRKASRPWGWICLVKVRGDRFCRRTAFMIRMGVDEPRRIICSPTNSI